MNPLAIVGWTAVGVLVLLWLVISFSAPGPRRATLEWLGASALYVALSTLFLNLVLRAREGGNTFALVAFGFLLVIFLGGLVVSLVNTLRSMGGRADSKSQVHATH